MTIEKKKKERSQKGRLHSPNFPLPNDSRLLATKIYQKAENIGLLFNKFLWIWDENWMLDASVKSWYFEQIQSIAIDYSHSSYNAFLDRQKKMVQALAEHGYKIIIFGKRAESRILSGLGGAHPMEVGFAFHPLYGFPYLPGSGLKGLARAWAELNGQDRDSIKKIFGSENKDKPEEPMQGDVVFFDAYSVLPPQLEVDIMNPHFSEYYRDPKNNFPTEWQNPNPVYFLTIGVGKKEDERPVFKFALAARSDEALQLAQEWLERGLENLGFGGKKSSGYGYFAEHRYLPQELDKIQKTRFTVKT